MGHQVSEWLRGHPELLAGAGVLSIVMLIASAALLPVIVSRMPADHFVVQSLGSKGLTRSPLGLAGRVLKNLLGTVLILAGFAMLFLPGQGILTILIGLGLVDFPGKRALEIRLLRIGSVQRGIGWLRRRAGKPPLQLPDGVEPGAEDERMSQSLR